MNSVTWMRDGVEVGSVFTQTQSLIDAALATYQHTLSSDSAGDFVGNFTCSVSDVDGNTDSRNLTSEYVGSELI